MSDGYYFRRIVFALALAFIAWLYYVLPSFPCNTPAALDSNVVASWVQAIGTIGAVGAGFIVSSRETRQAFQREKTLRIWERRRVYRDALRPLLSETKLLRAYVVANIEVLEMNRNNPIHGNRGVTKEQIKPLIEIDLIKYGNQVASADETSFEYRYLALRSVHSMMNYLTTAEFDSQILQLNSLKSMADSVIEQFDISFPAD